MHKSDAIITSVVALGLVVGGLAGCCRAPDASKEKAAFPVLTGSYLGQTPPGTEPKLFAPGIVSTGLATRDVAMTPDGDEMYFGVFVGPRAMILVSRLEAGSWSEPRVADFSGNYLDLEPHITPDGSRFLFLSTRPRPGQEEKAGWVYQDIWVMDRTDGSWGEPYNLGEPVNSDDAEYFPSVTRDGTIYFTRGQGREGAIYRSRLVDGTYQEPERLPEQVNCGTAQYNAFIAPDESYIIVCVAGRDDSIGRSDYYVVFRNPDDSWSDPVNMGGVVNAADGAQWSPYVTPDGRYLFFMSSRKSERASGALAGWTIGELLALQREPQNGASDIYWVDASVIEELRPPGVFVAT